MQNIAILGSTGSIGKSTLAVLAEHQDRFRVYALTANSNVELMLQQCLQFRPRFAVMADTDAAAQLAQRLRSAKQTETEVSGGEEQLNSIALEAEIDQVMAAIVGAAGLLPTLNAVRSGRRVLIANKEPLVMTGQLFMREAQNSGALILPIDSEHNAIFQCLPDDQGTAHVHRIHLTASGGPFRGRRWRDLEGVTPEQACAHPNWSMGRKISVDSATLMNKGLELIEASALFSIPPTQVEILIHPQSIIHSLVEYADGSLIAQLGAPDMRVPIAHALAWPDRITSGSERLSLAELKGLDFQQPDMAELPCLHLARSAASTGGSAPAILNAANEVAVAAFLEHRTGFHQIPQIIEKVMENMDSVTPQGIDDVLQIDNEARHRAERALNSLTPEVVG